MATKLKLRSTRLHSLRHYSATELEMSGIASDASFDEISEPILPATSSIRLIMASVDHRRSRRLTRR
jgi:hypothetical protein